MRMETADIFWRQEIRGWRQQIRLETADAGLETADAGLETADIFWRQQIFFGDSRYIWRQQIYLETGDIFQVDLETPRRCPSCYDSNHNSDPRFAGSADVIVNHWSEQFENP